MLSAEQVPAKVSLLKLKETVTRLLPLESPLRQLVLAEPDYIPQDEANTRAKLYLKVFRNEVLNQ